MTGEIKKKPTGLIRQDRVVPTLPEKKEEKQPVSKPEKNNDANLSKKHINQQKNIKVSNKTKEEIDILLKFSSHKFAYELIESMIDNYVENVLDSDQRRAFKTLSKMIKSE